MIVPNMAYRSMIAEREFQTYEMLQITTLDPRRIVWGKWWSAMVQMLVYYAAITPYMVFTNYLRGISLYSIAFMLLWSMIASACLAMLALASATMSRNKQSNAVLNVVTVLGGLWLSGVAASGSSFFLMSELPFDEPGFWLANSIALSFVVPVFVLVRQLATINLLFEGANRSTGIRVTCLVLTLVGVFWLGISMSSVLTWFSLPTGTYSTDDVIGFGIAFTIWLSVVALFSTTEEERLSRRMRRDLPPTAGSRLLRIPFLPGGGRAWLFMHLQVVLVGALLMAMTLSGSADVDRVFTFLVFLASYFYFYLGVTSFLGRLLRHTAPQVTPNHVRVSGILILAAGTLGPHLLELYDMFLGSRMPWLFATDPFSTLVRLSMNQLNGSVTTLVGMMGLLGVVLNLAPMLTGCREVLNAPVLAEPEKLAVTVDVPPV